MERRTVELRIGGQKVRVVSSATEDDLQRLATVVSRKLGEVSARGQPSQGLILAALALAHEVEAERSRRVAVELRARDLLGRVLGRIDHALALEESDSEDSDAPPDEPGGFT
jgi:cell division protein ZapA